MSKIISPQNFIETLRLFDFRNHKNKYFEFNSDKVIFWGSNAVGKTNILEAIVVLSLGKSWREIIGDDLIFDPNKSKNEASEKVLSAKIEIKLRDQNFYHTCIESKTRSFFKNEKKISLKQHRGNIPTLLFSPEMLALFSGSKSDRIKFFDRFLCQISPEYQDCLAKANRAHIQKTKTLKAISQNLCKPNMLMPWNHILAETMPEILEQRKKLTRRIVPILNEAYQKISGTSESLNLTFGNSGNLEFLELKETLKISPETVLEFLKQQETKEILLQKNLMAPNRGDYLFFLREKKVTQTASRGEIRSLLLALLFSQKKIFENIFQKLPILCLDDVFSELDDHRQKHLERLCEGTQTFFTTTHQEHFKNFTQSAEAIQI